MTQRKSSFTSESAFNTNPPTLPLKKYFTTFLQCCTRATANCESCDCCGHALLCFAANLGTWNWKWTKSKTVTRWTFPLRFGPNTTNSRCDRQHQEKWNCGISPGLVPPPCVVLLWLQAQKGGHFEIAVRGRVDCEVRLAAAASHIKWLMVHSLYKNTFGFKFH